MFADDRPLYDSVINPLKYSLNPAAVVIHSTNNIYPLFYFDVGKIALLLKT